MQETDRRLLQTIAKDVAKIRSEIVSLRIKVAAVSATVAMVVAIVTGLLFNELTIKSARAGSEGIRSDREIPSPAPSRLPNQSVGPR